MFSSSRRISHSTSSGGGSWRLGADEQPGVADQSCKKGREARRSGDYDGEERPEGLSFKRRLE